MLRVQEEREHMNSLYHMLRGTSSFHGKIAEKEIFRVNIRVIDQCLVWDED